MSKASYKVEKIEFEFGELTTVRVLVKALGDSPLGVQGVHEKAFPPSRSALDVLQNEIARGDFLLW